jgi:hypothetical protein
MFEYLLEMRSRTLANGSEFNRGRTELTFNSTWDLWFGACCSAYNTFHEGSVKVSMKNILHWFFKGQTHFGMLK